MKVPLLIWYFFRSLFLRGPLAHFRLLIQEYPTDRLLGIHTTGFKTSLNKQEHPYQGAAYTVLFPLLKEVKRLYPQHLFYDIGSGLGRVLCVAEYSGFQKLIGIEVDQDLLNLSLQNISRYRKSNPDSEFTVELTNALDYDYKDSPSVYFLFNPFDSETLGKFIDKVCLDNNQARCFVYMNPVYKHQFKEKKAIQVKTIKTNFYTEAIIYQIGPDS